MMWASLLLVVQDPAELVERLGSDDIEVRQAAEAELVRLGSASEDALEKGTRHADKEIAGRSARLLFDIVAPHRREANAELAHLLSHLREAVAQRRKKDVDTLLAALRRLDLEHPLPRDFELSLTAWEGCFLAREAALRKVAESKAFARVPDRATWASARIPAIEAIASTPSPGPCAACARWRMSAVKVGLMFENARVEDILKYLKDVGGLTIVIVDDRPFEHATTISAQDITLGEALERVLRPYGVGTRVTEEGAVLVERRAE